MLRISDARYLARLRHAIDVRKWEELRGGNNG